MNDPFVSRCEVEVAGGPLTVARAGSSIESADVVVLAVHGITASHLAWRAVARELAEEPGICLLAPDLRGRGGSAGLPGPYGIAANVTDLLALLDRVTPAPVVVGGHSMGAYVAARLAADHPERVSSLVLVDGGLPMAVPSDADPDELLAKALGSALDRLGQPFAHRDDYLALWRAHPAFSAAWNSDVEAYVNYDCEPALDTEWPDAVRSVVSLDAVRTDWKDMVLDDASRTAVRRVEVPVSLLLAPRGLFDDDRDPIPSEMLDEFAADHPNGHIEYVADTNHYTILLGDGPGPAHVAAAFRAAIRQAVT